MSPIHLAILILVFAIIRGALFLFSGIRIPEKHKKTINENLDSFIIAGITALILIHFVVRTFYIPSESMLPTLRVKDYILVNRFIYRFHPPQRGDIVVFHPPQTANSDGKDFIKRIVAVGGDTLEVKNEKLYINDQPQKEPYIYGPPYYDLSRRKIDQEKLFVMGDNRNNSDDSHVWGQLPVKNIIGKAFFIFWPPRRIGILK